MRVCPDPCPEDFIVPKRPTRPGKHAAPRKAHPVFARAAKRQLPNLRSLRLRRTGGTVVALGAVVLAGAAGNGATGGLADEASAQPQAAMDLPASSAGDTTARARVAAAADASRSTARTGAPSELRDHAAATDSIDATRADVARAKSVVPDDPRAIARQMVAEYGWSSSEFECLDDLWVSESDWEVDATNPTSGAYGIPQSLPAEKMASAGSDWRTNPATQIEWGLNYIDLSYGTPCSAWEFKQANNWY